MEELEEERLKRIHKRTAVVIPWRKQDSRNHLRHPQEKLEEAKRLAAAVQLNVVWENIYQLRNFHPATLLGKGQLEILCDILRQKEITVVIIDSKITPAQQRNLEKFTGCKVVDRTGLILQIFAKRAVTREGRLQVSLAQMQYERSRLVRLWTHLERQRGGGGFLGGAGETQMEADRRMIADRIVRLKRELEKVKKTRGLHRQARKRVPFPIVSLVGYTNAGKSTLFNALTHAHVKAQDQLFATLDPTMRSVVLPGGRTIILSDTVGFINDLPTELVAAFRATLEEVAQADIILHVRDCSHPQTSLQKKDVLRVLSNMAHDGMLESNWEERVIEVLNKVDLIVHHDGLVQLEGRVGVSALKGEGLSRLLEVIEERLSAQEKILSFVIPHHDGAAVAWLHQHGRIIDSSADEENTRLQVCLSDENNGRFLQKYPSYLEG